jgi:hypothetical protein
LRHRLPGLNLYDEVMVFNSNRLKKCYPKHLRLA